MTRDIILNFEQQLLEIDLLLLPHIDGYGLGIFNNLQRDYVLPPSEMYNEGKLIDFNVPTLFKRGTNITTNRGRVLLSVPDTPLLSVGTKPFKSLLGVKLFKDYIAEMCYKINPNREAFLKDLTGFGNDSNLLNIPIVNNQYLNQYSILKQYMNIEEVITNDIVGSVTSSYENYYKDAIYTTNVAELLETEINTSIQRFKQVNKIVPMEKVYRVNEILENLVNEITDYLLENKTCFISLEYTDTMMLLKNHGDLYAYRYKELIGG